MSKKLAIVQSNYIPWKGYFDLISMVDEFILFDDAQYTRNDWRNRNRIRAAHGLVWLTIPVQVSGRFGQRIRDAKVTDAKWATKHWKSIVTSYSRAPYFYHYRELFELLYQEAAHETMLSRINYQFTRAICEILGISTRISWSWNYQLAEGKTERLINLCQQAGASTYITGPAAKAYIDRRLFDAAGIKAAFIDYSGYPTYRQLYSAPFAHRVSVIDLILNTGPCAPKYMKGTICDL